MFAWFLFSGLFCRYLIVFVFIFLWIFVTLAERKNSQQNVVVVVLTIGSLPYNNYQKLLINPPHFFPPNDCIPHWTSLSSIPFPVVLPAACLNSSSSLLVPTLSFLPYPPHSQFLNIFLPTSHPYPYYLLNYNLFFTITHSPNNISFHILPIVTSVHGLSKLLFAL